jgi:DNA-3-methyladenine glycosylase I
LLNNKGIIRNRLKIEAAVQNARSVLGILDEFDSFDDYIWQFTGGQTIRNAWQTIDQVPAWTNESNAMSKDLKQRGFKFVGPTICYAFMQAAGMVNDHLVDCFRYQQVQAVRMR